MFRAKLPSLIVHLHGAVYMSWILLLTVQIVLAASGRVRWHMRLGVTGMFIAPLMVILGVAIMADAIRRKAFPSGKHADHHRQRHFDPRDFCWDGSVGVPGSPGSPHS
jgi:hypothetical protein